MAEYELIEEFHLAFRVRRSLPDAAAEAARRSLNRRRFRRRLERAVRGLLRRDAALAEVRVELTR